MMKLKASKANVCLILTIVLILVGCGSINKNEKTMVRVAYFPNITHAQALVMKEKRSLEEKLGNDCEVTWTSFNAGPAEVEAMFAGQIDIGYIGPVPAISANVKSKGDFKIIAGATNGGAALVTREGVDISTIADLANKKVAIPQLGNTQHLMLLKLLTDAGLAVSSKGGTVEVVAASNADILNLMDQGSIDAALVPEPWASTIVTKGNAKIALDYKQLWREGDYSTAVVVTSKEFVEEHADIVKQFMEVHKETTAYIVNNQEEVQAIVNNEIEADTGKSLEEDILDTAFKSMTVTEVIPADSIWAFAELNFQEGFIDKMPEDSLIDFSILDNLK